MKLYLTTYDGHPREGGRENLFDITGDASRIPVEFEPVAPGQLALTSDVKVVADGDCCASVVYLGLHMESGELFTHLRVGPVDVPFATINVSKGRMTISMEFEDSAMSVDRLKEAIDVIKFYADPEMYSAISFLGDPPCGGFTEDFGEDYNHPVISGPRPGKTAREFLRSIAQPDTLDIYVIEAIKGAIRKWEQIAAGTRVDGGVVDCPLCDWFYDDRRCDGCPVSERTKVGHCRGTPYVDWLTSFGAFGPDLADTPERKAIARAELDFLKSLLPDGR